MLLSEMFGVERDTSFGVKGFNDEFRVRFSGCEYLVVSDGKGAYNTVVSGYTIYGIVAGAPDNIIHLPPPLTDEQREQLKALYTLGYRWLAKDKYGSVYAYEAKPYERSRDKWLCYGDLYLCYTKPTKYLESLVSWSDSEPHDIGKALGVEG